MTNITWNELVKIEPELNTLLKNVQKVKDPGGESFCANDIWFDNFKERVTHLVGWYARRDDSRLTTSNAYDVVYQKLYNLLPDCRNCGCWGV